MKAYIKDILKEITNSLGRFLSILLIVAIGTAFFAGVRASVPDMKNSADHYFDEQNLHDVRILSTLGFTQEDVDAIKEVKGVKGISANYDMDFLSEKDNTQYVVETIGWEKQKNNDENYINQIRLVEGRLPQNDNECVIEEQKIQASRYEIGDTITLMSGTSDSIDDYLKETSYTIVGTCYTPDYLSYEKGTSTIGSGSVDTFIMIPKDNFIMEYYSEVLVTLQGAKETNTYSQDYFDIVDPIVERLEALGEKRSDLRFEEIQSEAQAQWDKNNQLYEDSKQTFNEEIAKAEEDLNQGEIEYTQGVNQLAAAKNEYAITINDANAQISEAEATLNASQVQLDGLIAQQKSTQQAYDNLMLTYDSDVATLETNIQNLEALRDSATDDAIKNAYQSQIDDLNTSLQQLQKGKTDLETGLATLNQNVTYYSAQLSAGREELQKQKDALAQGTIEANARFYESEQQLAQARAQLDEGRIELEENKIKGQEELDNAAENLATALEQINDIPEASWYTLDRNSHYSYRDYESVADRMDGIAKVFPLFFLIVAALVCLTTMTRMVDEQRGVIGTYKALGYSKQAIAVKYLAYALIAGIIGSIIGCSVGMHLFPAVIFNAWNIMYNLPGIVFSPQLPLAFISSFCVIGVTLLAAGFACYKDLMEVPASLMRPKAPKIGKRIFLERIPLLWSHFSFTMKVTARNILRYKKRFFMTVIGISGCTALLVSGYGIKDSISQIVEIQFGEIIKYDAIVTLDSDASLNDRLTTIQDLHKDDLVKDSLGLTTLNASINLDDSDQSISIVIPDDSEELNDFVGLRTRNHHEPLILNDDGAIVSEKLANNVNAKIGDTIRVTFDDEKKYDVKIGAICENYISHYIYMTPSYYHSLTGYNISENSVLVKMTKANDANEKTLGNTYIDRDSVSSLSFYRGVADSFDDTISSLSFITYVLIGAAALLAFVVLYNLTNVNISERLREIATIKVLGFYDLEVANYVYRENIFLTIIGSLAGLLLGIGLHSLIMDLAEMPTVMFGRNINFSSFVISVVITVIFGLIVNLVMYRKLKNIPMVESLKSVE